MTGDGYPDLMGQPPGGADDALPGPRHGGAANGYPAYGALTLATQIGVGRWNDDGAPDSLIRQGGSLTALRTATDPGGLSPPSRLRVDLSRYDWVIGVSDLHARGHPDLIVRQKGTGRLYALPGSPTGFRKPPLYLGQGLGGYDLAG